MICLLCGAEFDDGEIHECGPPKFDDCGPPKEQPTNESNDMAGRAKAQDLPGVEGPGVAPVIYKDLEKLGDEFVELRDKKAELATEMTGIQTKIIDKMIEKEIKIYRFSDQEIEIIDGKKKVKIKTVKVAGSDSDDDKD